MPHDVFISYATEDKRVADDACAAIEARGFRCWMAPRDVLAGTPYGEAIVDAIQAARLMVVVFSSSANASVHIPKEVERAASDGLTIIPFRIEAVLPAKSLNYFLASVHWLDAMDAPLDGQVRLLADTVEKKLNANAPTETNAKNTSVTPPALSKTEGSEDEASDAGQTTPRPKSSDVIPSAARNLSSAAYSITAQHKDRRKSLIAIAAVLLVAAFAGGGWYYRSHMDGGQVIDSVAVLPFVNGNGDPNMEYLSDGIAESLTNSLSQLPRLQVKSRDSAFHYKGKDTDPEIIGRELGVRAVFKGRVTQVGDDLTVAAELIDTQNDNQLWGQEYDRKVADIFTLRDELATQMAAALRMRLSGEEEKQLARNYTADPIAYQDYLQGRFWWNKRDAKGLNKATEYFQQAVAKDPNYALAYSGLADSYTLLAVSGYASPRDVFPKAKEAALTAVEKDDTLAEPHTSMGMIDAYYDWDWSGAEREFQRAISLNPGSADAHSFYGVALWGMGRIQESIAEKKRAIAIDPLSLVTNTFLGVTYLFARQYDQAIGQLQKTIELDPNFQVAHLFLGVAYVQKSMFEKGIAECEKAVMLSPGDAQTLSELGYAYAVAGKTKEAQRVLEQLNELSLHEYVPPSSRATVYAGLNEKGKAFEWLEKAYEERDTDGGTIKVNPVFDSLRPDPRWVEVMRRMNLTP